MSPPAAATVDVDALPDCYGLRRVNPFLGCVAVVRSEGGHALSQDGRSWQLQVAAHPPRGLWSGGGQGEELRYFRFGVWSTAEGMTRVPLNPILDVGRMLTESERLVAAIGAAAPRLPFPLAPELELWLLDRGGAPLALLATAVDADGLEDIGLPEFNAGGLGERPFHSATLAAQGVPVCGDTGPTRHAQVLEREIAGVAGGAGRQAQWFRRDADCMRCIGRQGPERLLGRRLPHTAFPALPLRTDWPDDRMRALVADYIQWLSPYLLTLPYLDDGLRAELERSASAYALAVSRLWRLYPRVLDAGFVRRARVEARLRRAHA